MLNDEVIILLSMQLKLILSEIKLSIFQFKN